VNGKMNHHLAGEADLATSGAGGGGTGAQGDRSAARYSLDFGTMREMRDWATSRKMEWLKNSSGNGSRLGRTAPLTPLSVLLRRR
jgi:hypothetical protein